MYYISRVSGAWSQQASSDYFYALLVNTVSYWDFKIFECEETEDIHDIANFDSIPKIEIPRILWTPAEAKDIFITVRNNLEVTTPFPRYTSNFKEVILNSIYRAGINRYRETLSLMYNRSELPSSIQNTCEIVDGILAPKHTL